MILFQQLTGINIIIYFFNSKNDFTDQNSLIFEQLGNIGLNFVATIVVIFIIDRIVIADIIIGVGRRPLLILGSISLSTLLLITTILLFVKNNLEVITKYKLISIFTALFGISYGPVVYLSTLTILDRFM